MDNFQKNLSNLLNYLEQEVLYMKSTSNKEIICEANGMTYTINKIKTLLIESGESNVTKDC